MGWTEKAILLSDSGMLAIVVVGLLYARVMILWLAGRLYNDVADVECVPSPTGGETRGAHDYIIRVRPKPIREWRVDLWYYPLVLLPLFWGALCLVRGIVFPLPALQDWFASLLMPVVAVVWAVLVWWKAFKLVHPRMRAVSQRFGGPYRIYKACNVLHISWFGFMRLVLFRYTAVQLEVADVPAMVRHTATPTDDGQVRATEHRFTLQLYWSLALCLEERLAFELAPGRPAPRTCMGEVLNVFYDDFAERGTSSLAQLRRAEEELVHAELDRRVRATFDAAVQECAAQGTYMAEMAANYDRANPAILCALQPRLLEQGILVTDVKLRGITGPYVEQLQRRSDAEEQAAADARIAVAQANARVAQAQEDLRAGTSERQRDATLVQQDVLVEQQRIQLALAAARTSVQGVLQEIAAYSSQHAQVAVVLRQLHEADPDKAALWNPIALREMLIELVPEIAEKVMTAWRGPSSP